MAILSRNNQVTIPSQVRRLKAWGPGTEVSVVIDEHNVVRLVTPREASEMLALPADELARARDATRRGLGRARA